MQNPELFLPILKYESKNTAREVSGLLRIFRDLKIGDNAKTLDLSCGIGRHSILLAKKGFNVVGYDPSKYYINIARNKAKTGISKIKGGPRFYVGDPGNPSYRLLKNKEKNFEIIISLFQSIGYISRKYDLRMFENLMKITSSQCYLILQTENKNWRLKNFESNKVNDYESIRAHEKWKFDLKRDVFKNQTKFYRKTNNEKYPKLVLSLPTYMILYSPKELKEIVTKAGWKYYKSYDRIGSLRPAGDNSKMPVSIYTIK